MRRIVVLAAVVLLIPALAFAVPTQIPYSGQLSESGQLVNGTRHFTFSLYAQSLGGSAIAVQAESLLVTNGVYYAQLNFGLLVWNGSDRWLGVSVNSGAELTPRTTIGSVPYAVRATIAERAIEPPEVVALNYTSVDSATITSTSWTPVAWVRVRPPGDGYALVSWTGSIEGTGTHPFFCGHLAITASAPSPFDGYPTDTDIIGKVRGALNQYLVLPASGSRVIQLVHNEWYMTLWARRCSDADDYVFTVTSYHLQVVWVRDRM
jgi:hypothetical protein